MANQRCMLYRMFRDVIDKLRECVMEAVWRVKGRVNHWSIQVHYRVNANYFQWSNNFELLYCIGFFSTLMCTPLHPLFKVGTLYPHACAPVRFCSEQQLRMSPVPTVVVFPAYCCGTPWISGNPPPPGGNLTGISQATEEAMAHVHLFLTICRDSCHRGSHLSARTWRRSVVLYPHSPRATRGTSSKHSGGPFCRKSL
jgi:hypothetical protein